MGRERGGFLNYRVPRLAHLPLNGERNRLFMEEEESFFLRAIDSSFCLQKRETGKVRAPLHEEEIFMVPHFLLEGGRGSR